MPKQQLSTDQESLLQLQILMALREIEAELSSYETKAYTRAFVADIREAVTRWERRIATENERLLGLTRQLALC